MASINKLSIRGVRSFSPDDAEQVLEFYFPCTIIVGANGCGKTTIIESLKFAVAGAMPPGNKSGQAFVHDPRSLNRSTVKANVKLRFTGRAGNQMVVVRAMEVSQKKTTMSFKQLDGTLRSQDRDGNRISMGHKCSELDRQLPLLLGVSKAILEHVVFCHQEDASWPLQEGAVLKKRFDDIFDSTRYSKALKVYADLKKQYASQAKDLKVDQASIASHQHAAKGFRQELTKYNEQMEVLEEEIKEQKDTEKEIMEEEQRLQEILDMVDQIERQKSDLTRALEEEQTKLKTMTAMVNSDLTGRHTISELKRMVDEFDDKRSDQMDQKSDLERQLARLGKERSKAQTEYNALQVEFAVLESKKEKHQANLKERFEKMMHLGNSYALADALTAITQSQHTQTQNTSYTVDGSSRLDMSLVDQDMQEPVLDISRSDMEEFKRAVENKDEELASALKELIDRHREAEESVRSKKASIASEIGTLKARQKDLNDESAKARDRLRTLKSELSTGRIHLRQSDVDDARQKADQCERTAQQLVSDPRKSEVDLEIRDARDRIDKLKREIEDDQVVERELLKTSDSQHAITVLRQQISQEVLNLEEVVRDYTFDAQSFNISSFPKELPGIDEMGDDGSGLNKAINTFVDHVGDKFEGHKLDLERETTELKRLEAIVSERKGALNSDQNSLKDKRIRMEQLESPSGSLRCVLEVVQELKAYQAEIGEPLPDDINETRPFELLEYLNLRLKEIDADSLDGITQETVKKIIRKLWTLGVNDEEADAFLCPCCKRGVDDDDFLRQTKVHFKSLYSAGSPLLAGVEESKVARAKYVQWVDNVSTRSQDLLEYRRLVDEVKTLESKVGDLEEKLQESSRQLAKQKSTTEDLSEEFDKLRSLLDAASHWAEDARKIAIKRTQVKEKENDLSMYAGIDSKGRDLATLQRDLKERSHEREELINKVSQLGKEQTALNTSISNAMGQAKRLHDIYIEKVATHKEGQEKFVQKKELGDKLEEYNIKFQKLSNDLAPLEQKEKSKEQELGRLMKMNQEERQRQSDTLNSFRDVSRDLKKLMDAIEIYEASATEDSLTNHENRSQALKGQVESKTEAIAAIQPALKEVQKAIEDQDAHKKNLEENLSILNARHKIEKLKKDIAHVKAKINSVAGHETAVDDLDSLSNRKTKIGKAIARIEGRRGELVEGMRSVKRKLSSPEYRDVDEEYRVATIKLETTQLAVKDLEKYHNALDKALLKFHSLKIAEINKIIRDLWTLTYKGEDITSIKIVSGQESGAKASRSYNYRVVMSKGSNELDMRGRCSAGQRVLASIVIRLALAETFCLNFGCIALDEPTVNLDHENRRGLAIALAQIIASRAKQSNFQLIMITHDKDFVSMMKTELASQSGFDMPEKYFLVRREEGTDGKFYSKIDGIDWDEL